MSQNNLSPLVKETYYSDFLIDLNPHPVVKDIVKYTNEYTVIASIKNLLLTNKGERLYQPDIGGDIRRLLFEPIGESTSELLSVAVQQTIANHEPRAKVTKVDVQAVPDNNLYVVTITFYVINNVEPITTNITLSRVR